MDEESFEEEEEMVACPRCERIPPVGRVCPLCGMNSDSEEWQAVRRLIGDEPGMDTALSFVPAEVAAAYRLSAPGLVSVWASERHKRKYRDESALLAAAIVAPSLYKDTILDCIRQVRERPTWTEPLGDEVDT